MGSTLWCSSTKHVDQNNIFMILKISDFLKASLENDSFILAVVSGLMGSVWLLT